MFDKCTNNALAYYGFVRCVDDDGATYWHNHESRIVGKPTQWVIVSGADELANGCSERALIDILKSWFSNS